MKWTAVDKDFVAHTKDVVFRLHMIDIGFYGGGKAYSLKARKNGEVKEEILNFTFWFREDGSDRYEDKSVGGKLWKRQVAPYRYEPDTDAIKKEATKILKQLGF